MKIVKTKKTELLFMALSLRLLRIGGRAAVVVPDGVLFGSSTAHKDIRKMLVEDHKLDAIIKLPSGVFRPYAGVSCAIVVFTKTGVGGTDGVWFYDMTADGFSLDDKRTPLLDAEQLGACPAQALSAEEHAKNNLPDILARWGDWEAEAAQAIFHEMFGAEAAPVVAKKSQLIRDFCEVSSGSTPSRANSAFFDGEIPWVKTGKVKGGVIADTEEKISQDAIIAARLKVYPSACSNMAKLRQGNRVSIWAEMANEPICISRHGLPRPVRDSTKG